MIVLKNGIVHDGLGHVEVKDIAMTDGKLVDPTLADDHATVYDVRGMHVLPGFVDTISSWGILGKNYEIRSTTDDNDEQSSVSTPEMNVKYGFDGRGITIQQLCAFGITTVGVAPTENNIFGGTIAAFEVEGISPFKMMLKENIGMRCSVTKSVKNTYGKRGVAPMTNMGIFAILQEELRKAAEYNPNKEGVKRDEKLLALKKVTDGDMPVFVSCESVAQMRYVKEIFAPYNTYTVFVEPFGLDNTCDFLLDGKSALVLSYVNSSQDVKRKTDYQAALAYYQQGVPVSLCGSHGGFEGREDTLWSGIEMVKQTKDPVTTLKCMTSESAKLLGIFDRVGSLETGKCANVVVWSEDPLQSFAASVEYSFLNGELRYKRGDEWKCYL